MKKVYWNSQKKKKQNQKTNAIVVGADAKSASKQRPDIFKQCTAHEKGDKKQRKRQPRRRRVESGQPQQQWRWTASGSRKKFLPPGECVWWYFNGEHGEHAVPAQMTANAREATIYFISVVLLFRSFCYCGQCHLNEAALCLYFHNLSNNIKSVEIVIFCKQFVFWGLGCEWILFECLATVFEVSTVLRGSFSGLILYICIPTRDDDLNWASFICHMERRKRLQLD